MIYKRISAMALASIVLSCGASANHSTSAAEATSTTTSGEGGAGPGSLSNSSSTSAAADSTSSSEPSSSSSADGGAMCGHNYASENCDIDWSERNGQACNWWVDDCGPDAACNYVEVGVAACQPIVAGAAGLYEPCSGNTCEKGLVCAGGYCYARCSCDATRPHCMDDDAVCIINDPEDLESALCTSKCDPLEPLCPAPGTECQFWHEPTCWHSSYAPVLQIGDECGDEFVEACAEGLWCAEGGTLCNSERCCSPVCAVDDVAACAELGPTFSCSEVSEWPFDDGCYDGLGVCRGA